jgi:hypothetical protein
LQAAEKQMMQHRPQGLMQHRPQGLMQKLLSLQKPMTLQKL